MEEITRFLSRRGLARKTRLSAFASRERSHRQVVIRALTSFVKPAKQLQERRRGTNQAAEQNPFRIKPRGPETSQAKARQAPEEATVGTTRPVKHVQEAMRTHDHGVEVARAAVKSKLLRVQTVCRPERRGKKQRATPRAQGLQSLPFRAPLSGFQACRVRMRLLLP
ncbi:hypothetical protein HPB51_029390 [Rhipicephalus microplus]|uniref:Uncharacterized protein n=1 Tax=Rhipicephalus microplus TaxID=6941 RepID=A0A9J6CUV1_RHIMP|nr:hypothetical protein HPB51_029390 [Rhipicephalus microplus]